VRQFPQKPFGRPGRPPAARPTGFAHDEQNRWSSGTDSTTFAISSSDITATIGSPTGVGSTTTRPAPTRARDVERRDESVRRLAPAVRVLGGTGDAVDCTRADEPVNTEARPVAAGPPGAPPGATTGAAAGAASTGSWYFAPHVSQ
jgi:hypothetical protein